ncbi:hypothetical protein A2U01_0091970 [Trifolium medium]|uniref:Uncharacterized protein n=1 Tax=Trifolium medium TaxID=97028 RepID=A0A392UCY5_9FABA|nr:hypothetical protein [Trifolium medium]
MDETGPSRPRGKVATMSVRWAKEKALEEAGGRPIGQCVVQSQPEAKPHGDPEPCG